MLFRFRDFQRFIWPFFLLDLKPENVLICIDDVESIIQSELAATSQNTQSPSTRLVGVPPSKGRGGNQTPRSESVVITGSQPLPSPSSSFGSSPMLDKWAFGMSKIDGEDSKPASVGSASGLVGGFGDSPEKDKAKRADFTELAVAAENISISSQDMFGAKTSTLQPAIPPGPSLLTQQAPSHTTSVSLPTLPDGVSLTPPPSSSMDVYAVGTPLSSSAMSVDSRDISNMFESSERITVKIADLGNGERDVSINRFSSMY
jgi:serine/threonine-protein kinase SRPK3